MTISFKPSEGKERLYYKRLRHDFHEEQINKLPNEFRKAFSNYNHRNTDELGLIDHNSYYIYENE
jgi:hypothetical protein